VYYPTLISSESHQRGDTPQKKKKKYFFLYFYSIPFFLIYLKKNKNIYLKIYIFVQPISFSQPQRIYRHKEKLFVVFWYLLSTYFYTRLTVCVCMSSRDRIIYNKIINNSHTYELCMFPFDWASAIHIFQSRMIFKPTEQGLILTFFSLYIRLDLIR
jgi:hypothetical protein